MWKFSFHPPFSDTALNIFIAFVSQLLFLAAADCFLTFLLLEVPFCSCFFFIFSYLSRKSRSHAFIAVSHFHL